MKTVKTHYRTKADGRKVKVDQNPKNDRDDGRNATVRHYKPIVEALENEIAELKEANYTLQAANDELDWDNKALQATINAHEYKVKISVIVMSALAGALIVFIALLATDLFGSFLSLFL